MNQQMHPMVGRLISIFRRGDIEYNVHCGLMLLSLSVGAGFVGAGFVLSDEKLMGKGRG